jgi:hypothetical protein
MVSLLGVLLLALVRRAASTGHQTVTAYLASQEEGLPFTQRQHRSQGSRTSEHLQGVHVPSMLNQENVAPYANRYRGRTGVLLANGASLDQYAPQCWTAGPTQHTLGCHSHRPQHPSTRIDHTLTHSHPPTTRAGTTTCSTMSWASA